MALLYAFCLTLYFQVKHNLVKLMRWLTIIIDYINEARIKPNSPYYDDRLKNWKLAQNVLDKLNIELEIKVDLILKGNTAQLLRIAQVNHI